MILYPGVTRCPSCGRFIYATDDVFAAQPWAGVEQIPGFEPGIYHYPCFLASPHRDAFLELDAEARIRSLGKNTEYVKTLARNSSFALTFRLATEEFTLFFLRLGRQLSFLRSEQWQQFVCAVALADELHPTFCVRQDTLRLRRDGPEWELAAREFVPIEADFAQPDFARLRKRLTARGIDPARTRVEVGALCLELNIQPSGLSCPLERLTGIFDWPEVPAETAQPISITVQVEKWYAIPLSNDEFVAFREFVCQSNLLC